MPFLYIITLQYFGLWCLDLPESVRIHADSAGSSSHSQCLAISSFVISVYQHHSVQVSSHLLMKRINSSRCCRSQMQLATVLASRISATAKLPTANARINQPICAPEVHDPVRAGKLTWHGMAQAAAAAGSKRIRKIRNMWSIIFIYLFISSFRLK